MPFTVGWRPVTYLPFCLQLLQLLMIVFLVSPPLQSSTYESSRHSNPFAQISAFRIALPFTVVVVSTTVSGIFAAPLAAGAQLQPMQH